MGKERPPATCHPEKPHWAKGLCAACYTAKWAAEHPERMAERRKAHKESGPRATCHPDLPVLAQGMCQACYRREWRKDPEKHEKEKAYHRDWQRERNNRPGQMRLRTLKRYGLTLETYEELLISQGGHCATCPATEKLQVDHCHTRGNVRAILCGNCNSALGYAKDDAGRLRALADYVDRFAADDELVSDAA